MTKAKEHDGPSEERIPSWVYKICIPAVCLVLVAFVIWIGERWIDNVEKLDERVGSLEKDVAVVRTDVESVKSDLGIVRTDVKELGDNSQRVESKMDTLTELLKERLPRKSD